LPGGVSAQAKHLGCVEGQQGLLLRELASQHQAPQHRKQFRIEQFLCMQAGLG